MTHTLLTTAMTLALLPAATDHGPQVKPLIQPLIDAGLIPGAVVGIYQNGESSVYAFGHLSKDKPTAPNSKTMYEIGSISKVFTGILLADAVERGIVKVDDPLSKHLPDGIKGPKRDGKEILLWHLSTHTSGLPRLPDNIGAEIANPYKAYGTRELWDYMDRATVLTDPGKTYAYSNLGAGLLGTLLAKASNSTYEKLLKERIATPLGMKHTTLTLSRQQKRALAPPHNGDRVVSGWDFDSLAGCGGVRSNMDDMLKLVEATLSQGSDAVERAITSSTKKRFTLPNAPAGVGLGWHIAQDGSTLWHNGQTGGYSSAMFVSKVLNAGVVVLTNGSDPATTVVGERILQMLMGIKVEPPSVRKSIDMSARALDQLVGEYPSTVGFTIYITRDGDALMAQLTNQSPLQVWPESPTLFFYRDVEAQLRFAVDSKTGEATSVTLLQDGRELYCQRKAK